MTFLPLHNFFNSIFHDTWLFFRHFQLIWIALLCLKSKEKKQWAVFFRLMSMWVCCRIPKRINERLLSWNLFCRCPMSMVAYGCHSKINNCLSFFIVYFSFLYIFFVLIDLICWFFLGRVLFLCGMYRKLNFIYSENVLFCRRFICDEFYFDAKN